MNPAIRGLLLVARLVLGGIFIYASLDKIASPKGFAGSVYYWNVVPWNLVSVVSLTLPWIELIAGAALILGVTTRGSALVISGLLTVFIGAAIFNILRDYCPNCGCFGEGRPLDWRLVIEDAAMLLGALWIAFGPETPLQLLRPRAVATA